MSIEAMKQALEALGSYMEATDSEADAEAHSLMAAAFFKLKEAVAEAEKQEPVAWVNLDQYGNLHESSSHTVPPDTFPVYRHPPAAQRQPLTDEEIDAGVAAWFATETVVGGRPFEKRMRAAIEAAHGIGEKK